MISGLFSLPFLPADAAPSAVGSGPRYTYGAICDAFLAGPENALVRRLATAAGDKLLPYNPIVIYGPPGVGKSSLAHALAARRRGRFHLPSTIETTGADLARGLAHAIDTASAGDFRSRHHRCDLDCRTERKGRPYTLVCKKNTASYQANLATYHQDLEHLAALRAIRQGLPTARWGVKRAGARRR